MPKIPSNVKLTSNAWDVMNAIRNNATVDYRSYVPEANNSIESCHKIGNIMMQMPFIRNEFAPALVNRIALTLITSKSYYNPWTFFKRGLIELGETVEEVFVDIVEPHVFDQEVAEREAFKREMPNIKSAFHALNSRIFYKQTITRAMIQRAFLSWEGVSDLISKIVEAMYKSLNLDEFSIMKYMLAVNILNGRFYPITVEAENAQRDNLKMTVGDIKAISNLLEFASDQYNPAGVTTASTKDEQYLILNAKYQAHIDVEVLAAAFNMDRVQFMGHMVIVDSFGALPDNRLAKLFAKDENYQPITAVQKQALDMIPGVLVDRDFFMIFDNLLEFEEIKNGEGLYWNYWLHAWKTFSTSPFSNAVVFVPGEPSVTSVTISPSDVSVHVGQKVALTAIVDTKNYASKAVTWSSSDPDNFSVDLFGVVSVSANASGSATITATSTYDPTISGTATVTAT